MINSYLTVSKLNLYIKSVVEGDYSLMNITLLGEVSGLTKHYTGHFYFTLKDENSSIKCMMFSSYASKINFDVKNGDEVLVRGYVGVYEKTGVYQFYCTSMNLYGEGKYLLELARLKEKLEKEGIFSKPKKSLPFLPTRIGLITAKTGAAIHDFLTTVKKRFKVEVYIFPCLVQGEEASKDIIRAIKLAKEFLLDVLVITRGGGAKEDLKCFNDEALIRECYTLEIPLISAIGHQIDTTLIDYVSDYQAITPTDAATLVVPDSKELHNKISRNIQFIERYIISYYKNLMQNLLSLSRNVEAYSPKNRLMIHQEKIKNLMEKIININKLSQQRRYNTLHELDDRLLICQMKRLNSLNLTLKVLVHKLSYLNPFHLLENGYSVITQNNRIISSITDVNIDDVITIKLKDGQIKARILNKEK